MLTNYIRIACRSIRSERLVSGISVLSLTLGTTCALILFVFLRHEFVRDDFHENKDRILRIYAKDASGTRETEMIRASLHGGLAPQFAEAFPSVETMIRYRVSWGRLRPDDRTIRYNEMAFADSTLFSALSFEILHGDRRPLGKPDEAVLTVRGARRLIGENADPASLVGQRLLFFSREDRPWPVTISAIAYDPPSTSSLYFELLLPFEMRATMEQGNDIGAMILCLLKPGVAAETAFDALPEFASTYFAPKEQALRDSGSWSQPESPFTLHLQPLTRIYADKLPGDHFWYMPGILVVVITVLGGTVFTVGCLNFVVLSLGRLGQRSREVGMRKVSGALRRQIIGQYVVESTTLATLSIILAIGLTDVLMPHVSKALILPNYPSRWTFTPVSVVFLCCLPIVVGLLTGAYPGLVLARLEVVPILRGQKRLHRSRLMTALVVAQFTGTVFLLGSTQLLLEQVGYLNELDRGFNDQNLLLIDPNSRDNLAFYRELRARVRNDPGVLKRAGVCSNLGSGHRMYRDRHSGIEFSHLGVSHNIVPFLSLQLLNGSDLHDGGSSNDVLVDERTVKTMGWTVESAIGQTLPFKYREIEDPRVIGVIRNFYYLHPAEPLGKRPLILHQSRGEYTKRVLLQLDPAQAGATRRRVEAICREIDPEAPTSVTFVGETSRRMVDEEILFLETLGGATSFFGLTISCLGLFGLSVYTLTSRTKEVGIRKTLGATAQSILLLMARHLFGLVAAGCVIGCVAAYYGVQPLLNEFSLQLEQGIDKFVAPIALVLGFAVLSVGYQILKVSASNPVDELRTE